ncbi:hypothetical protein [Rhodopseudomonas sp. RCAM05734]|uniref:hypothetical protein n=1 Tax=Rhodopseudomonas sp. RCAM05734 TaxID=3457549 RepID=UPI004044B932
MDAEQTDAIRRLIAGRDAKINLLLATNALLSLHLRDERRALSAERVQLQSEREIHAAAERERSAAMAAMQRKFYMPVLPPRLRAIARRAKAWLRSPQP